MPDSFVASILCHSSDHRNKGVMASSRVFPNGLRVSHGRSAGVRSSLPQFVRAIEYLVARLEEEGQPVKLSVAHSLGATGAAFAGARYSPVERMVLLAPAASPRAFTCFFARLLGLNERTRAGMQGRIEAREGGLMRQFEPGVLGARVSVPMLVVHDRRDMINRFSDGEAYVGCVTGAQLMATEGLGHGAILDDATVLAGVVAFSNGFNVLN